MTVDVWAAPVTDGEATPRSFLAALDDRERARCRRLVLAADRRRFLASRALLRRALQVSLGGGAGRCRVVTDDLGKPRVDIPGVGISVSHSARGVAVAVCRGAETGVDIERVDAGALGDHTLGVFSADEEAWLSSLSTERRWRARLGLWTLKEAYAKLLGLGFEFDLASVEMARVARAEDLVLGSTELPLAGEPYLLSVAASAPREKAQVTLRILAPGELEGLSCVG